MSEWLQVSLLLAHGSSSDSRDEDGRNALWYACRYEQKLTAMLLRKARRDEAGLKQSWVKRAVPVVRAK